MAAQLDHLVLEVADIERSLAFYRDVVGLEPVRLEEFRAGQAPFVSLRVDGDTLIDLFPRRLWRGRRPCNPNHFCLALERREVSALKRRLVRRGITITRTDARNFGARGFGVSLYFDDPDGISVEVRHYRA